MVERINPNIIIQRCIKAGIDFWLAGQVAIALKDKMKRKLLQATIDKMVIEELKKHDPNAAQQYESYHFINVRTSKNIIEPFERDKIVKSLIKETRVSKIVAEEIAKNVENDIRKLQLRNISAPLIREMVNAKLLEKRMDSEKLKYTRIGLPVYDISQMIRKKSMSSPRLFKESFINAIMQEYILTRILPQQISNMHLNADLHIHDLHDFITSPISFEHDIRVFLKNGLAFPGIIKTKPAKSAEVAISHVVRAALASIKFVSGGISIDHFNVFIAPYIRRMSKKSIRQLCQKFLYEINYELMGKKAITINMDSEIPKELSSKKAVSKGGEFKGTYGEYEDESRAFLREMMYMRDKSYPEVSFLYPDINVTYCGEDCRSLLKEAKQEVYLTRGDNLVYGNTLPTMNMRGGVMQSVSINIVKIAYENKNETVFYNKLEDVIEKAFDVCKKKYEIIERRLSGNDVLNVLTAEYEGEAYIKLENYFNIITYEGLPQAVKILSGSETFTSKELDLMEKILRFTRRKIREEERASGLKFRIGEVVGSDAHEHFAEHNKRYDIEMSSEKIKPKAAEPPVVRRLQQLCDGALFYETDDIALAELLKFVKVKAK